ncbi:MAG TPA: Xaa-Pro aminopeptidase [Candidatus Saccharibacteria bacterium]|nr:Xaa-Pro aminopeptidase [Candidatus Saccharibacteria bacterium]
MSFNAQFYVDNRRRLAGKLPDSIVFIPAHVRLQQSADMAYPFRQDNNFLYLTGLHEPDLWMMLDCDKNEATLLFDEQSDYAKEWEGERDTTDISRRSGIKRFGSKAELGSLVKRALKQKKTICYLEPAPERLEPYGFITNPARRFLTERLKMHATELQDIRLDIARLRQIKQPVELESIQRAIDITATGLRNTRESLKTFQNEKDIERFLSAEFYMNGAEGHAYEPIIAGGINAATIHYQSNDAQIDHKSLLLLDVGARYDGYAADISRTWAFREPTKRQTEIFKAVEELQEIAFSKLKPGVKLRDYQSEMEKVAADIRKKLGKDVSPFPHGFSHFLGLDVHDAGDYASPLEPNMVLTVEPGFYFADEHIGIRLEDNIRITDSGIENMSKQIPKVLY